MSVQLSQTEYQIEGQFSINDNYVLCHTEGCESNIGGKTCIHKMLEQLLQTDYQIEGQFSINDNYVLCHAEGCESNIGGKNLCKTCI